MTDPVERIWARLGDSDRLEPTTLGRRAGGCSVSCLGHTVLPSEFKDNKESTFLKEAAIGTLRLLTGSLVCGWIEFEISTKSPSMLTGRAHAVARRKHPETAL